MGIDEKTYCRGPDGEVMPDAPVTGKLCDLLFADG